MSCSRRFYRQFCVLLHTFSGPFLHKGFWTERFARRLSHRYHTRGSGLSQSTARKHWSAPNAVQSLPSSTCVSAHPSQSCFTHAEVGIQQKDRRCIESFGLRCISTTTFPANLIHGSDSNRSKHGDRISRTSRHLHHALTARDPCLAEHKIGSSDP